MTHPRIDVLVIFVASIILQLSLGLGLVTPERSWLAAFCGALMSVGAFGIQGWLFKDKTPLNPEFWRQDRLWRRPKEAPTVLGGHPLEETKAESQLESLASFYGRESLMIRGATLLYPIVCLLVLRKLQLFPLSFAGFFAFGLPLALLIPACVTPQFLIPVALTAISTFTYLLSDSGFSVFNSPGVFASTLLFALTTFLIVRLAAHLIRDQHHPAENFQPRPFHPSAEIPRFLAIAGACIFFGFVFSKIFPKPMGGSHHSTRYQDSRTSGKTASVQGEMMRTSSSGSTGAGPSGEQQQAGSGAGPGGEQQHAGSGAGPSGEQQQSASGPGPGGEQQQAASGPGPGGEQQQAASGASPSGEQQQAGSGASRDREKAPSTATQKPKFTPPKFIPPKIPPETLKRGLILLAFLALAIVLAQVLSRRKKSPQKKPRTLSPSARRELLQAIQEIEKRRLSPEQEIIQKYCAFLKAMETTEYPWPKHLPTELYSERLSWTHGPIRDPLKGITGDHSDCYYGAVTADSTRLERFRVQYREVVEKVLSGERS